MNKKLLVVGVSVVAIAAAHTAFWVYQSGKIKSSIEQMAGQISKEIGKKNTEFFYTSSAVSGYPFNFTVNIKQPKFISAGSGEKLELSSGEEPIVVVSSLLGSSCKLKLPTKIDVKRTVNEKEKNYKLEFTNAAPEVDLKFTSMSLFSTKEITEAMPYLSNRLKNFTYSDSGYVLSGMEDGLKIASSDSDYIQIIKTSGKQNNILTSYNIKVKNMDHSAFFADEENSGVTSIATLWPINASIDLSSDDMRDESGKSSSVAFMVKEADIAAASFGFVIKGDVQANGEDIFPFGNLSIKVNGYQNMVDYFSGTVSNALANSKIPLFNIKSEKSIDFKKVLYDVASEKSNEDKDILLTISREKGKSLFIGQKGLMEVIDLLKASASAPVPVHEVKKEASAPLKLPGFMNTAPAAGIVGDLPKAK